MLVAVAFALMTWASYASDRVTALYEELFTVYQSKVRHQQMIRLSESVSRYVSEMGSYPVSLAALVVTPGFEHVAGLLNNWQGYGLSPTLNDANWAYRRVVLFTNDPTTGTSTVNYLAANACGSGGYDTALSWCGTKTSMWYRQEGRDSFNDLIVNERARVNRLSQKFANYYNAQAAYPSKDEANVALAADSITGLATLVGYAGTATNCSGQYQYQGIPIDCSDMFNSWGLQVGYQFVDASHIILVSETRIVNATGATIIVAVDRT